MDVKEISLADLKPYEKNPRRNDSAVDAVAKSIKEFGWKQPVVIDSDNVIVCGHTRFKAAQKLGLEKVPCIVADDLTPEQIKAFRLVDNKTAELAGWDFEKLDAELAGLDGLTFDMKDFGFADSPHIDFEQINELTEESYKEPKQKQLTCPKCGHVASSSSFKKANA